jgi:predicted GIY-YIG superfamily endonuclease
MRKTKNYWSEENCTEEAKKYEKRSDFKKFSGGAYNFAKKNGLLDIVCLHMNPTGNRFKRLVYTYLFPDRYIYVGLTYNIDIRDNKHKRDEGSPVFKHIKKTGLVPDLKYSELMAVREAIELERKEIDFYKKNGFNILNKAKAGGLGGGADVWTFENCKTEARKYNSRREFALKSGSAYNASRRLECLDEVCSHMVKLRDSRKKGYWEKGKCASVAKKCKSRSEFENKYAGAYMACLRNGWLDEICSHMKGKGKKPNGYWTKEKCLEEGLKHKTKSSFRKNGAVAYLKSKENNWLDEICLHINKTDKTENN